MNVDLKSLRERPGMYGLDGSFGQFTAFFLGIEMATDQLAGFREWLVVRFDGGDNLVWAGLVLRLAWPDLGSGGRNLLGDPDRHAAAVETLFRLLGEFAEQQAEPGGAAAMHADYLAWVRRPRQAPR